MSMRETINTQMFGQRPVGIDLFAGAGGLSLGFEQAGFDIAAAVDVDPIHCAVHEYNFPLTRSICADVANLRGEDIRSRAKLGGIDIGIVFGGAPCQGFSMIGKRALDDPRNGLVAHFVRLVLELSPKYCLFENVKGLTIGKHAVILTEMIETLQKGGYDVLLPYQVLNAANYGVPQDRRRLFLIAARSGASLPRYPVPSFENVTVWDALEDLPDADTFEELKTLDSIPVEWMTRSPYARKLRGLDVDIKNFSYGRAFDHNCLTSSMRTEHTELSKARFEATISGKTEPVSRFRKLAFDGLCNTLRAGTDSARGAFTSPRPIHPTFSRVVTVREAARLHSYPDWFRFHVTKWHGFRQIGNSVPPFLGRAVAAQIIEAIGIIPIKPERILDLRDETLLSFDMSAAAKYFGVAANVVPQRKRKLQKD
ncbi:MAG: DNA cytosine methyltransferase [Synergistaceae bacterium]|nr:DNA cytosine methyltransferase [Synergistaceae bacterium]